MIRLYQNKNYGWFKIYASIAGPPTLYELDLRPMLCHPAHFHSDQNLNHSLMKTIASPWPPVKSHHCVRCGLLIQQNWVTTTPSNCSPFRISRHRHIYILRSHSGSLWPILPTRGRHLRDIFCLWTLIKLSPWLTTYNTKNIWWTITGIVT